jgi:hypothetical protein
MKMFGKRRKFSNFFLQKIAENLQKIFLYQNKEKN